MKKIYGWLAAALLGWLLIRPLRPLTYACLGAAALAYLLLPLCRRLERRMKPAWAALCTLGLLAAGLAGASALILPSLVRQGRGLLDRLPALWESAGAFYGTLRSRAQSALGVRLPPMKDGLSELLREWAEGLEMPSLGTLSLILLLPVLSFYFLCDRQNLFQLFLYLIPSARRPAVAALLCRIHRRLSRYLLSQGLVALFVGGLTAAGLALIGLPYALLLGGVMMLMDMIPYFGPVLGAVPIALVALAGGKLWLALLAVIAVQQAENLFITPLITGSQLQLHPLVVMLSILTGGMLGGVAGMLLALPLVLIVRECLLCFASGRLQGD